MEAVWAFHHNSQWLQCCEQRLLKSTNALISGSTIIRKPLLSESPIRLKVMQISLNGSSHELPNESTVSTLLESLGLMQRRVAVELNEEIIPRSQHASTPLQAGDRVEVVHAIGGG